MKQLLFLFILSISILGLNSCSKKDAKNNVAEEIAKTEVNVAAPVKLPDPSGTYSDSDGGLSFTFYSSGKFSSELLGETTFGTWTRIGNNIELTYDEGGFANAPSTATVKNGDGYIIFNGTRLSK
ncbi:hypothetical protein LBMAG36_10340 [Chlorobiota bacterium]|nr:hypothetical protein LBMAG36_10340 [Chlorobiota bacterium]